MDYLYNKKHGITFQFVDYLGQLQTRDTWFDYKLIPKGRPFAAPPTPKTIYIDIPGLDGKLDFTEAVMGRPVFNNRSGSWTFINSGEINSYDNRLRLRDELDGALMNVILHGDEFHFYRGRVQLSSINVSADGSGTEFVIDYNLNPYKYSIGIITPPTAAEVKFDLNIKTIYDTNFNDDYYRSIILRGYEEVIHVDNRGSYTPASVFCSGTDVWVTVINREMNNVRLKLDLGNNQNCFMLIPGYNIMAFSGHGRVQLYYAEGRL